METALTLSDVDEDPTSGTSTPPVVAPKAPARSRWQDEDKEDSEEVRSSPQVTLKRH
jgi:hypothetical protein